MVLRKIVIGETMIEAFVCDCQTPRDMSCLITRNGSMLWAFVFSLALIGYMFCTEFFNAAACLACKDHVEATRWTNPIEDG